MAAGDGLRAYRRWWPLQTLPPRGAGGLPAHPGMILRPEHVIAIRANWRPKSANLRSLSDELDLGLDTAGRRGT